MTQTATPPSADLRKKRTLSFIILLQILVILAVVGLSRYMLSSSVDKTLSDREQSMLAKAQGKAAQLTVWAGTLSEQALGQANSDQVRLFASEAEGRDAAAIFRGSAASDDLLMLDSNSFMSDSEQLAAQAPMMRRQLTDFAAQNGFTCATMMNSAGQVYLSTHNAEELEQHHANMERVAAAALERSKLFFSPVRRTPENRLVMDVAAPLVAPLYVDASGKRMVGVLLLSVDVTEKIADYTQIAPTGGGESSRILQYLSAPTAGSMQELLSQPTIVDIVDLPGWMPSEDGTLRLAERSLPARNGMEEELVLSLAVPVPGLPWMVEQDTSQAHVMAAYQSFRNQVIVSAVLTCLLGALALAMLWWWLVGRRERAYAQEIGRLYETVNQQKQIIDSVNTTLADGIVLTDLNGNIPYANQAFADMASESLAAINRKTCQVLNNKDVAQNLIKNISAVRQQDMALTFHDELLVQGQDRHYQIVSSPFRDEGGRMLGVVSVYRDITNLVEAQERNQHMVNQTVHVFVRAIEAVDPYLRGQATYTGELAMALARELGMEDHEALLRTAANLSQVGMMQLPHDLLTKTGTLTPEERVQMEQHIEYAYNALEGIDFGMPVLEAIMQMNERLDGSGYPKHLSGDQIGMDGRVLAVAATFCALMRPRSYRQARSLDEAMTILETEPPLYDPEVVDALSGFLESPDGREFLKNIVEQ